MESIIQYLKANPFLLVILAIAAVWFYFRTSSSGIASIEEFNKIIRAGKPVVVEIYSNT